MPPTQPGLRRAFYAAIDQQEAQLFKSLAIGHDRMISYRLTERGMRYTIEKRTGNRKALRYFNSLRLSEGRQLLNEWIGAVKYTIVTAWWRGY